VHLISHKLVDSFNLTINRYFYCYVQAPEFFISWEIRDLGRGKEWNAAADLVFSLSLSLGSRLLERVPRVERTCVRLRVNVRF